MVPKIKSVEYVIIFVIFLSKEFHQTSPQNETESKSVSSSKSNQEPMLQVNSTQMPTLDPQSNSFVQPTTLRLQHNLTVQPTASTEVVQSPSEEQTKLTASATPQVTSSSIPTLDPLANSFVQPTTLRLQHNLTVEPTATTQVVQKPSEEQTKLTASATPQVTSSPIPTLDPQANSSEQVTTQRLQHNVTVQPTATSEVVQKPSEEQTKLTANTTTQVTSWPIPTLDPQANLSVQPTTLRLEHYLTVEPTATSEVVQEPSEEQTKLTASATPQVTSSPIPSLDPQANSSVQVITQRLQHNVTFIPTATTQVIQKPSEEQTKLTARATTRVNLSPVPSLNPQANSSVQPMTLRLEHNLTVEPTATTQVVQNLLEEQTKLSANTTTQVTSWPIPSLDPEANLSVQPTTLRLQHNLSVEPTATTQLVQSPSEEQTKLTASATPQVTSSPIPTLDPQANSSEQVTTQRLQHNVTVQPTATSEVVQKPSEEQTKLSANTTTQVTSSPIPPLDPQANLSVQPTTLRLQHNLTVEPTATSEVVQKPSKEQTKLTANATTQVTSSPIPSLDPQANSSVQVITQRLQHNVTFIPTATPQVIQKPSEEQTKLTARATTRVNLSPVPSLNPQANSSVQPMTLRLEHNLTVEPTATTQVVQNLLEEQTKLSENTTTQVTSWPIPSLDPQANLSVQPTTLRLQHNLTVEPTATTQVVQKPSEEQTKLTASATPQVTSSPIPTLDPQANSSEQVTTQRLQHNVTVQPTATSEVVQKPSEEQTKLSANTTTQVTSWPIPTLDPQANLSVQPTTLRLQHNLTVEPTATTQVVQSPSEEQTKLTASATPQVTSSPIPTLDPQANSSEQVTTQRLQHNVTVQPTATSEVVQKPSEEQTKLTANTTTQVTSSPIPPLDPQANLSVQPTTLRLEHYLTVEPTATSEVVQEPSKEQTKLTANATPQVTSSPIPSLDPQANSSVQVITQRLQHNVTFIPTATTQVIQKPSEEQTKLTARATTRVNLSPVPSLNPQANSSVQPMTLRLEHNLTVEPTATTQVVQNLLEEQTKLSENTTTQVTSWPIPSLDPQANLSVQPTTLRLQHNLTVEPTATTQGVQKPSEEQTKLTASATPQVTSSPIPTLDPQANSSEQVTTQRLQHNVTVQPTATSEVVQKPSEEQTKLSANTTTQVTSWPIPTLDPQANLSVQPTTLRLQHNLTVEPTATTQVVQSPSEEQTKLTASATPQVTSSPIPTLDPQANSSEQVTTQRLQHNVTVQPTATSEVVQKPSEEQTKLTTNATTQVTSSPIPTLNPQGNSSVQPTTLRLQQNLTVQPTAITQVVQKPSEEQTKLIASATPQVTSTPIPTLAPQPMTNSSPSDTGIDL
ncbi:mucin-2-like [Pocillopora verrucosa]|uniref:mucin-2-like n=1 Tax=Pocillopora verrucosa TaxID=203993 RepID=UPI00334125E7